MIDKQLKNEFKKRRCRFCGENLIVRKLNVCFIKWRSVGEHFFVLTMGNNRCVKMAYFCHLALRMDMRLIVHSEWMTSHFGPWRLYTSAELKESRLGGNYDHRFYPGCVKPKTSGYHARH